MTSPGRSLRDSLREGLVVVVSILIAFGLDAWWDYRVERRQEAETVSSLRDEFQANRDRLIGDIQRVEDYTSATARVLAAADSGGAVHDSLDLRDLWQTLSWRTSNLTTATLDAVISAGRLEIVRERELRTGVPEQPRLAARCVSRVARCEARAAGSAGSAPRAAARRILSRACAHPRGCDGSTGTWDGRTP